MTQEIQFDTDRPITTIELRAVSVLASIFKDHNLRVTDDPTNIKIYVGEYYKETHRYWIGEDGQVMQSLVEKDVSEPDADEADWQGTSWSEAYDELMGKVK